MKISFDKAVIESVKKSLEENNDELKLVGKNICDVQGAITTTLCSLQKLEALIEQNNLNGFSLGELIGGENGLVDEKRQLNDEKYQLRDEKQKLMTEKEQLRNKEVQLSNKEEKLSNKEEQLRNKEEKLSNNLQEKLSENIPG